MSPGRPDRKTRLARSTRPISSLGSQGPRSYSTEGPPCAGKGSLRSSVRGSTPPRRSRLRRGRPELAQLANEPPLRIPGPGLREPRVFRQVLRGVGVAVLGGLVADRSVQGAAIEDARVAGPHRWQRQAV